MKNNKAFYRSALATAIVMALSAPAFAADNAVSTTPVTLDKDKTTLDQDVVINGDKKITAVTIETSDSDKDLNVNRPGFPGECFICELRLPDHRFRWKHNKL
ncbi:hypothetical protein LH640_02845, partial [Escherichia coli]|nr:hypothetical protein [Escherichia coli]